MARWNNGAVGYTNGFLRSEKSTPQDAPNDASAQASLSSEARQRIQREAVRKSQGRFTATNSATYQLGGPDAKEHMRGAADLPFVDFPGIKISDGGDLRDMNALGGGMPPGASSIGSGIPGRKSEYRRNLAKRMDHASPVKRI